MLAIHSQEFVLYMVLIVAAQFYMRPKKIIMRKGVTVLTARPA